MPNLGLARQPEGVQRYVEGEIVHCGQILHPLTTNLLFVEKG